MRKEVRFDDITCRKAEYVEPQQKAYDKGYLRGRNRSCDEALAILKREVTVPRPPDVAEEDASSFMQGVDDACSYNAGIWETELRRRFVF